MAKEKFVLVSLQEDKAKRLAQAITNESCRKILDYLADKEATESELSETLEIPLSTVHYNLKQLMDSGLVSSEEYHYSEKGKEVNHYRLANKYIIIASKSVWGIKEKLRSILPVVLIVSAAAGLIQVFSKYLVRPATPVFSASRQMAEKEAADAVGGAAVPAAAPMVEETLVEPLRAVPNIALWFLIGALVAIATYFIVDFYRNKKSDN
jgi:DNA-binding transcriptional ArsR family regulator